MARGGKRKGAGRKVSKLPQRILEELGPIPIGDPLGQARWWTNAIGVLTLGVMSGEPWKELLETVRASASAAGRVIPHDIIFEAARIVNQDAKDVAKNVGGATAMKRGDDDVARSGAGSVRRDPS